jgi:peptide methionine sulfoxide reductase MsrB
MSECQYLRRTELDWASGILETAEYPLWTCEVSSSPKYPSKKKFSAGGGVGSLVGRFGQEAIVMYGEVISWDSLQALSSFSTELCSQHPSNLGLGNFTLVYHETRISNSHLKLLYSKDI